MCAGVWGGTRGCGTGLYRFQWGTENVGPVARLGVVVETIAQEGVQNNHVLLDGRQAATSMLYEMSSTRWGSHNGVVGAVDHG